MCVMCLAAQRSFDECCDADGASDPLALNDPNTAAASSSSVSDYRSILYYLDGGDNFRWNAENSLGTSVLVTYSFGEGSELPSTSGSHSNPYGASSFSSFTNAQKNNFRLAAAEFMAVSGIVLVETDGGGDINVFNAHGTYVGGYADLPYVNGSYQSEVDLVIDSSGSYAEGSYGYFTILHELGHAVGLDHTHEGRYTLNNGMDTTATTVMSYNYDHEASGLQSLDNAALEHLYGEQVVSSGWSFSYKANKARVDASGSTGADMLLVPATLDGTAFATKIMGYGGHDQISGQDAMDILRGNQGNDMLDGMGGNDRLRGGSGSDTIYGGSGDDFIHGGSGADTIYGEGGNDLILGGAAADEISGGWGNDDLSGHLNDDTLDGGAGDDVLTGGKGNDLLSGGSGVDMFIFRNTAAHDTITDFDAASETLRFEGTGRSFADVLVTTVDGHAQVQVGDVVIDLLGVSAAAIGADDFEFI